MTSTTPTDALDGPGKTIVLVFDGTANNFHGDQRDTNVMMIYRMLERGPKDIHYYQPGIGTYSKKEQEYIPSAGHQAVDFWRSTRSMLLGYGLEYHIMAGYKVLMRHYKKGDSIYMFGFSRGAYVARCLAEMLNYIGLLSPGNHELVLFAFQTFYRWHKRKHSGIDSSAKRRGQFLYMSKFRDTFCQPISPPIRFMGLFDMVNSAHKFEVPFLKRKSPRPYAARANVMSIRHAVAIDERRAKFRPDLISQGHAFPSETSSVWESRSLTFPFVPTPGGPALPEPTVPREPSPQNRKRRSCPTRVKSFEPPFRARNSENPDEEDTEDPSDIKEVWFPGSHSDIGGGFHIPVNGWSLHLIPLIWMISEAQNAGLKFKLKDLKDLGFYPMNKMDLATQSPVDDKIPEREKQRRDSLNSEKLRRPPDDPKLKSLVIDELTQCYSSYFREIRWNPNYSDSQVGSSSDEEQASQRRPSNTQPFFNLNTLPSFDPTVSLRDFDNNNPPHPKSDSLEALLDYYTSLYCAATMSKLHDPLSFTNITESPLKSYTAIKKYLWVAMFNLTEIYPFRRMQLQDDNVNWKSGRFPLPLRQVRDIPRNSLVHVSVLWRMAANEDYRPGNLLIGGGTRGLHRAPTFVGMGKWTLADQRDDPTRLTFHQKARPNKKDFANNLIKRLRLVRATWLPTRQARKGKHRERITGSTTTTTSGSDDSTVSPTEVTHEEPSTRQRKRDVLSRILRL